jgi:hypothetical protein
MTTEQKISILIRKYGSKSVIKDNTSSLLGEKNSFSSNKVLPEQIWVDLKSIDGPKNPLRNSPVNLEVWPAGSNDPIMVKIIKKPLTWIPGTNAFYDPSDVTDRSTVVDIISPDVHTSYSPYVYILNTQSNRYLHHISPGEYGWVFDYETGCLVFTDGLPSFMKSPQFQPPAITCYRYLGRKTAVGLSSNLTQGPTGPTGPTGETGETRIDSMVWRGEYNSLISDYSINDTVVSNGIVWVKTTGPTGPTTITSQYFDSITYNELVAGFIGTLNEQFIDDEYVINQTPYFEDLNQLSVLLSSDFTGIGDELKRNDQNINIFNVVGSQNFYSKTFSPYSNRLYFHSPKKITDGMEVYLENSGYRLMSIDGLRSSDSAIKVESSLRISKSRLTGTGNIDFLANSSVVPNGMPDISANFADDLFQGCMITLNGSSRVTSSEFQGCTIVIGDPGVNSPVPKAHYDGIIHYFEDVRFSDTVFNLAYSGQYNNLTIIFNRCRLSESRTEIEDAGFTFPNPPDAFFPNNPLIKVLFVFIDSTVTTENLNFNLIDGSIVTVMGTNVFPSRVFPSSNITGYPTGNITQDPTLSKFLDTQNSYSLVNPRTTTNFYFNQ